MSGLPRRSVLAGAAAALATAPARAAAWPDRPVTWIVPYPPGGGSDLFARPIAALLHQRLGEAMTIDNRSGAGGTVGAAVAARAAPDGHTLLVGDTALTYAPLVYPSAGFDFGRDFAPIAGLARVPYVLLVNPARLDVASLDAFIAAARQTPGRIDIGSAGLGSVTHFAITLFEARAGIRLTTVPYRGGAPMLQDLLAGQVMAAFVLGNVAAPYVQTGKLRALAVAARRREPLMPWVPTTAEAGLDEFRARTWFGLFAPRGTPEAVLDRLHDEVMMALRDGAVQRLWETRGARVEIESRADFARYVATEIERWSRIARDADLRLD